MDPVLLIVAVGVASLVVAVAIGFALDAFLARAEAEESAPRPSSRSLRRELQKDQRVVMASHAEVVRRHAREQARLTVDRS